MWIAFLLGLLSPLLLWIILRLKTSRPDGIHLSKIHPYRAMMVHVMKTRAESIVFYDLEIDAAPIKAYVKEAREVFHTDMTHCLVGAIAIGLIKAPEMNQFSMGHRLYQRKGRWITFSMKRQKGNKRAKIATVKSEIPEGLTFRELCEHLQASIGEQRSDKVTYHDKEYNLLTKLPTPILGMGVNIVKAFDTLNLLPGSFIEGDALYTSAFVANLGSIGMKTAYHHLYEWGNCPLFIMAGKTEQKPVVIDGKVEIKEVLPLRITYDERIDDGLTANDGLKAVQAALEDPYRYLGCLKEDGSDTFPLGESADPATD